MSSTSTTLLERFYFSISGADELLEYNWNVRAKMFVKGVVKDDVGGR
jgi:hypothetical protein